MDFLRDSLDDQFDQSAVIRQRANASLDTLSATFTSPPKRKLTYPGTHPKLQTSWRESSRNRDILKQAMTREPQNVLPIFEDPASPVIRLRTLLDQNDRKQKYYRNLTSSPELEAIKKFSSAPWELRNVIREEPDFLPSAEDLMPILNGQSAYIQQLEGENGFLKEELSSLKNKVDAVIRENSKLNEELKTMVIQGILTDEENKGTDKPFEAIGDQSGVTQTADHRKSEKPFFLQWIKEHEKLKSLYESRVSQLDAQLSYTRTNLKKQENKVEELETALRMQKAQSLLNRPSSAIEKGLCVKCARDEATVVSSPNSKSITEKLERAVRERDNLVDSLTAVQAHTMELEKRESEAFTQVQQSIQLVEEAQLERNQVIFEKEQLRENLAKMEERFNDLITENQEKVNKEREFTRQECHGEMHQLTLKVQELENELVVTKNEIERICTEKSHLKSELEECKQQLKQKDSDFNKMNEDVRYSTATAKVQRDSAFRELERTRTSMEIELRDKTQEKLRLMSELEEVRRRMETAEEGLTACQKERLSLTDKFNSVQRELSMTKMEKESTERSNSERIKMATHQKDQRQQELKQTIFEMESQHALTVAGLEAMISDQNSLISKLRDQGRMLTTKLEKITEDFSAEKRRLTQTNHELTSRSDRLFDQHGEMERQCIEHGKLHQKLKTRLNQMDQHAKKTAKQVVELLQIQNELLYDRDALKKEVEFLRKQINAEAAPSSDITGRNQEERNSRFVPTRDSDYI